MPPNPAQKKAIPGSAGDSASPPRARAPPENSRFKRRRKRRRGISHHSRRGENPAPLLTISARQYMTECSTHTDSSMPVQSAVKNLQDDARTQRLGLDALSSHFPAQHTNAGTTPALLYAPLCNSLRPRLHRQGQYGMSRRPLSPSPSTILPANGKCQPNGLTNSPCTHKIPACYLNFASMILHLLRMFDAR